MVDVPHAPFFDRLGHLIKRRPRVTDVGPHPFGPAGHREFFRTARPTSTGVQGVGLLRKDALIEISAVAVLGSAASHA